MCSLHCGIVVYSLSWRHATCYRLSVSDTDIGLFQMVWPYHVVTRIGGKLRENVRALCLIKKSGFYCSDIQVYNSPMLKIRHS